MKLPKLNTTKYKLKTSRLIAARNRRTAQKQFETINYWIRKSE